MWQGDVKGHIWMGKNISFSGLDPRSGWKEFGVTWSNIKSPSQCQGMEQDDLEGSFQAKLILWS